MSRDKPFATISVTLTEAEYMSMVKKMYIGQAKTDFIRQAIKAYNPKKENKKR